MFEILITFLAGMISFLSPCVLPLVPAYIGYMSGRVTHTVAAQVTVGGAAALRTQPTSARFSTFLHGIAFVAGFTFIFVLLGVASTSLLRLMGGELTVTEMIGRIGGITVMFLGLHFMGLLPAAFRRLRRSAIINSPVFSVLVGAAGVLLVVWCATGTLMPWATAHGEIPGWMIGLGVVGAGALVIFMTIAGAFTQPAAFWNKLMNTIELALYSDTRREMTASGQQGFANSAFMGVVFAAGWTPCIGPTLGAALSLAIAGDTAASITRGGVLLGAYSLGLGIPFLLTALMLDSTQGVFRSLQRHMQTIQLVSGAFLIFIGFIIASGQLQTLSLRYSAQFGEFSLRMEECTLSFFEGDLPLGQLGDCYNGQVDVDGTPIQPEENAHLPLLSVSMTVLPVWAEQSLALNK